MWRKQIRAERAAEQAFHAAAKAKALQEAVMAPRPGSSGNEGPTSEDVSEAEGDNRSGSTLVTTSHGSTALARAETYRTAASVDSNSDSNSGDDNERLSGAKREEKSPKGKNTSTKSAQADEDDGNLADNDRK